VRLRRKLTIAFFGLSSLLSVLLAMFLYRFIERQLTAEYRDRLRDVTHVGVHAIDRPAYGRLVARLGESLDDAAVSDIELSADYRLISDQLQVIRGAEPELIRYAYLIAPTSDPALPRFVVDADVLELRRRASTTAAPAGEAEVISHFNQRYEDDIPLLREALVLCAPRYETEFVYDATYKLSSVSAYVPLTDLEGRALRGPSGRCLGVLGIDISDKNMRATLENAGSLAIRLSLAVIALALIVSIAMGTVLTRTIHQLTLTMKRFAAKDFGARTAVRSRDEIGQLGASFNTMATTIQQHSEHLEDMVAQRTVELTEEKAISERLLLNVLPGPIAERLKQGESLIVDRFDAVSVLFADIVGFTAVASRTSPEELVTMLNEIFSMFDRLAEQHGLEKIKTIGDAYMVVAGIPQPVADHATAIAHMALDMQAGIAAFAEASGEPMSIRIGIHSGSVVAGVIGTKKFIYDLWGDTVNTASRMESSGVPGRIQVTEATYALLRDQFAFEDRGPIEVKGKGRMAAYLLVGR
jgi:class 3 adenylate cyclase